MAHRIEIIVWNIRLPQALAAILAGAGLAVSGAAMQSILRNPLGSPFTLGISHAAAFGAAIAVVFLGAGEMTASQAGTMAIYNPYMTTLGAFVFSLVSAAIIVLIARMRGAAPEVMVLTGVALGSLFSAGTMFLQYFADDVELAAIVFWTFGDTSRADWSELGLLAVITVVTSLYFIAQSWNYNAIDAGDETAKGLGVRGRTPADCWHDPGFAADGGIDLLSRHYRFCRAGGAAHDPPGDRLRSSLPAAGLSVRWRRAAPGCRHSGASHSGAASAAGLDPHGLSRRAGFHLADHQETLIMLQTNGLGFAFKDHAILTDIALRANPGRILVILGPNGVGKTTLLKCLNGILKAGAGTILVDGDDLRQLAPSAIATRVGYVAQRCETSRLTVFDAVLMGRKPHMNWQVSKADIALTEAVIGRLGLVPLALRHVTELSGGEFQKVSVARALVQEPRLMLLDEPTSALDLRNQIEILSLLREIVNDGRMAAVMTMHDLNMALRFADDVLFLKDGRILSSGPVSEVSAELVSEAYAQRSRFTGSTACPSLSQPEG